MFSELTEEDYELIGRVWAEHRTGGREVVAPAREGGGHPPGDPDTLLRGEDGSQTCEARDSRCEARGELRPYGLGGIGGKLCRTSSPSSCYLYRGVRSRATSARACMRPGGVRIHGTAPRTAGSSPSRGTASSTTLGYCPEWCWMGN